MFHTIYTIITVLLHISLCLPLALLVTISIAILCHLLEQLNDLHLLTLQTHRKVCKSTSPLVRYLKLARILLFQNFHNFAHYLISRVKYLILSGLKLEDSTAPLMMTCPVCLEEIQQKCTLSRLFPLFALLECGHIFCVECIGECHRRFDLRCPFCRQISTSFVISWKAGLIWLWNTLLYRK